MAKNCWEVKECGREPGGPKAAELGICIATVYKGVHGINRGTNGGRCCWAVAGTLCNGEVQGTYAVKILDCIQCNFYQQVQIEEEIRAARLGDILNALV